MISKCFSARSFNGAHFLTRQQSTIKYTKNHEYIKIDDSNPQVAFVGISKFCTEVMGDVVNVRGIPKVGTKISKQRDQIASIESSKATSEFPSPVSGEVLEIDNQILRNPKILANKPTTDGWILKVKLDSNEELSDLLDEESYKKMCDSISGSKTSPGPSV